MEEQQENLFAGFPPVSKSEWEARIMEDLKGADYDKKLVSRPIENFSIQPFYTADDLSGLRYLDQEPGAFPFVRSEKTSSNHWEIRQDFRVHHIETASGRARMAAERGVTSLGFDLTGKENISYTEFRKLLEGIDFSSKGINIMADSKANDMLDYLKKATEEHKTGPKEVHGSVEFDPMGWLAVTGGFYGTEKDDFDLAGRLLSTVKKELPRFRVLCMNSHLFNDNGASAVQELAFGLAMAAEYLTRLTEAGHHASEIAAHMQWNMGVGSDYFMEIAKSRAARLLFSALLSAFHAGDIPAYIHSITTRWNKTLYDPHVNMLRLTTEAMAAVLGGCNSLLVRPYDSCFREQGDFSERIARNVQIILKEESYFDKVVDPAAGSYYLETLTHQLAENAWKLFLTLDEKGGFVKAFISGFIAGEIDRTSSGRLDMVNTRREVLLGTNQYPNARERISAQVDPEVAFGGFSPNKNPVAKPLVTLRAAMEFEKIRLATENYKGRKPAVFMLTIGNLAMRLARSQFACNFFACAGYEVIDNLGFASAEKGVEAAMESGAEIIVICSSDDEYATVAPLVFDLVHGRAVVVVAGAPACMDELKQKGLKEFIHVRSNVHEMLKHFHSLLGIV